MKYIDNDMNKGIEYDWNLIMKEYEKLGCPPYVYSPRDSMKSSAKYHIALSERSIGKTTNWILLGCVMNKLYGTIWHIVRQTDDMTAPKIMSEMLSVVNAYRYPEKLTDGKYNSIGYRNRKFFYQKIEDGEVVEKSSEHIGQALSIDKHQDYKSSYNCPTGDLIIFDEFISDIYRPNEFINFCDLVKTVCRDRLSPHIVMLANTINRHSTYFAEMGLNRIISTMRTGDSRTHETEKGTIIYVEMAANKIPKVRQLVNRLFYGFDNPKLNAIVGGDWAIDNYPHIIPDDELELDAPTEVLARHIYMKFNAELVELEICRNPIQGVHIRVHNAYMPKRPDECRFYTINKDDYKSNYIFKFGFDNLSKFLWKLYEMNKWLYATNDCGEIVRSYIVEARG